MEVIQFYKVNDPFGYFSNFAPYPIVLVNEVWPTVEHYFQANKFDDFKVWDVIKYIKSPMEAAKEGRDRKYKLKSDWEEIKDKVMHKALKAKFLQHPEY